MLCRLQVASQPGWREALAAQVVQLKVQASQLANMVSYCSERCHTAGIGLCLLASLFGRLPALPLEPLCCTAPDPSSHACLPCPACPTVPQPLASPEEQQRLEAYKALTSDKLRPSRDPGALGWPPGLLGGRLAGCVVEIQTGRDASSASVRWCFHPCA